MRKKTIRVPKPIRSSQIPVTLQMLNDMEGRMDHKISSVREDVSAVKAEIKSEIHGVKAELHRMSLMMEEQKAQNVFVMDGYAQLYALIERKLG